MSADSVLPHRRHPPVTRLGQTLDKLMGGHLLDRRIDGIDFLPFLTVLLAAGLITAGIFGDGNLSNLNLFGNLGGLNNGNIILRARDDNQNRPRRSLNGYGRDIPENNIR